MYWNPEDMLTVARQHQQQLRGPAGPLLLAIVGLGARRLLTADPAARRLFRARLDDWRCGRFPKQLVRHLIVKFELGV